MNEYKIAVIPGETFGMNNGCYLRVSCYFLEWLESGVHVRMKGFSRVFEDFRLPHPLLIFVQSRGRKALID